MTPLPMFYCPSRRACKNYKISTTVYNCNSLSTGAKTDYAANVGSYNSGTSSSNSYSDWATGRGKVKNRTWTQSSHNGVVYDFSEITMGEIRDGSSNTYLLGEKYVSPDYYETTTSYDDNGLYAGQDQDNARTAGTLSSKTLVAPLQDRIGYPGSVQFGSPHAGTFGTVMCDGSVQRISYSVDAETHIYLAARNDGKPVTIQ